MTAPASTLLVLECSPRGDDSTAHLIGKGLATELTRRHAGLTIRRRALGEQPLPPISSAYANALITPPDRHDATLRAALALSDELIAELEAADHLLIATPVHNYTVPVALKAWIDHVVRPGASFKSTPQGKVGMLRNKPTLVAVTAGGAMFDGEPRQPDFFRPYLMAVFRTIGITDVEFVTLNRTTRLSDPLAGAMALVREWIARPATSPTRERTA